MADVVDIKKTLKQWETQFRKEHGRKPNKVKRTQVTDQQDKIIDIAYSVTC